MGFEGTQGRQDSRAPFWPVRLTAAPGWGRLAEPPRKARHIASMPQVPDHATPPDRLLTCSEVGSWLRLHPKTVKRWALAGRLPSFRVGGRVLFASGDIAHFLAERRAD